MKVDITFKNASPLTLTLKNSSLANGSWVTPPAATIPPMSRTDLIVQGDATNLAVAGFAYDTSNGGSISFDFSYRWVSDSHPDQNQFTIGGNVGVEGYEPFTEDRGDVATLDLSPLGGPNPNPAPVVSDGSTTTYSYIITLVPAV